MKKLLSLAVLGLILTASINSAFAANNVSEMAVVKDGQHVAECAQKMDKGISDCVKMLKCEL